MVWDVDCTILRRTPCPDEKHPLHRQPVVIPNLLSARQPIISPHHSLLCTNCRLLSYSSVFLLSTKRDSSSPLLLFNTLRRALLPSAHQLPFSPTLSHSSSLLFLFFHCLTYTRLATKFLALPIYYKSYISQFSLCCIFNLSSLNCVLMNAKENKIDGIKGS